MKRLREKRHGWHGKTTLPSYTACSTKLEKREKVERKGGLGKGKGNAVPSVTPCQGAHDRKGENVCQKFFRLSKRSDRTGQAHVDKIFVAI